MILTHIFLRRLLADAKYLHEKLSVLKNVGAPTALLETLVSEKVIGRAGKPDTSQQGGTSSSASSSQGLTRSSTLSTNQRLKGLISGKRPSFMMNSDRAPTPPSQMPPPPPPASDKPRSPVLSQHLNVNNIYGAGLNADHFGSVSQVSLPDGGGQASDPQNAEGL